MLLKNILSTFSSKLGISAINFIILIITAKFLGAEIRGEISLFVLGMAINTMISGIIGGPALVYLIPNSKKNNYVLPSYLWSILVSIIGSYLLMVFDLIPKHLWIHLILLTSFACIKATNEQVLMANKRIREFNISNFLFSFFQILLIVYLVLIEHRKDVFVFIEAIYIGQILGGFYTFWSSKDLLNNANWTLDLNYIAKAFSKGFYNQIANISQILSNRINYYLLGSTFIIGIYSTGISVNESIMLLSGSAATILYTEVANEKNKNRSGELTIKLTRAFTWITFFGLIILCLIPETVYTTIFGNDFLGIKNVILFLSPGILFHAFSAQISNFFSGMGKQLTTAIGSAVSLVVTTVIAIILIPKDGLIGASIAASIGYFARWVYLVIMFKIEQSFELWDLVDPTSLTRDVRKYLN